MTQRAEVEIASHEASSTFVQTSLVLRESIGNYEEYLRQGRRVSETTSSSFTFPPSLQFLFDAIFEIIDSRGQAVATFVVLSANRAFLSCGEWHDKSSRIFRCQIFRLPNLQKIRSMRHRTTANSIESSARQIVLPVTPSPRSR